ncbi:MAG: hypothetical protein ACJAVS_001094 [Paracoccaceae bacterium]|jgi:hypothetical protein
MTDARRIAVALTVALLGVVPAHAGELIDASRAFFKDALLTRCVPAILTGTPLNTDRYLRVSDQTARRAYGVDRFAVWTAPTRPPAALIDFEPATCGTLLVFSGDAEWVFALADEWFGPKTSFTLVSESGEGDVSKRRYQAVRPGAPTVDVQISASGRSGRVLATVAAIKAGSQ